MGSLNSGFNIPTIQTIQKAMPTKFGCRLLAYMTPEPAKGQDEFIKSCLLTGSNALKKQGDKEYSPDSKNTLPWDAFYNPGTNKDGWGLVNYAKHHAVYAEKGVEPASEDPNFDRVTKRLARTPSNVVMAHLRAGKNRIKENLHPFNYQGWSFMHNGIVPVPVAKKLQKGIDKKYGKALDVTVQGTTDSEKVFYTILGKVNEQLDTTRLTPKDYPVLIDVFKNEVRRLTDLAKGHDKGHSVHQRFKDLTGLNVTENSTVTTRPSYNFVLAQSDIVMASCYNRTLHLGVTTNSDGRKEVLIASETIQPDIESDARIQWWQVPNEHIVVLQRNEVNPNEDIKISILPF